jgi:hypothetical protein
MRRIWSFGRVAGAIALIALSLLDGISVGGIALRGSDTLLVLAGILLLWPMLQSLAERGGEAKLFGIRLSCHS